MELINLFPSFSFRCYVASNDIIDSEYGRISKETVLTYFRVLLSRHSLGGT
jgi:hypothetical protein